MNGISGAGMTSQRTRVRMIERLRTQGIQNERVLTAMTHVPRHIFVADALAHRAYEDNALPIIEGQTISQPYIVARMIELLLLNRAQLGKTLEVGVGCGYQAAVLSLLTDKVYGIERIAAMVPLARSNFRKLKIHSIRLRHGDGMLGLAEGAPYDSIIVAAAAAVLPHSLLEQLAEGGRLLIPLTKFNGQGDKEQIIKCYIRNQDQFSEQSYDLVRFVPLLPGLA